MTVVAWLRRRRHSLALVLSGLLLVAACSGEQSDPASDELPADLVHAIDERFELHGIDRVRAVVVLQDGMTVLADYRDTTPETTWDIESVTKSVLSMLVGHAIGEGVLSLDQTLAELLPEHVDAMAQWQRRLTLGDLLTHSGGFSGDDDATFALMAEADPVDRMLSRALRPSGKDFLYSNEGSQIIATILRRATGASLLEYARATLFDHLDITTRPAWEDPARSDVTSAEVEEYLDAGFAWPVDSDGTHLGWGLMKLTPVDMSKIGTLMLNAGTWEGTRILPAAWVAESTRDQISTESGPNDRLSAYGYHWWVTTAGNHPAYLAFGYGGQFIEVVPALDLVVVMVRELDYENLAADDVNPNAMTDVVADLIAPQFQ